MSPVRMSKVEAGMRVVLAFHVAFNQHDVTTMMQYMSDDCVLETSSPAPDGTVYSGKEVIAHFWQDFFRMSPTAHVKIEEIFGFGNRCVMRWRYEQVDDAGSTRHVRGAAIFQVKQDVINEVLFYTKA